MPIPKAQIVFLTGGNKVQCTHCRHILPAKWCDQGVVIDNCPRCASEFDQPSSFNTQLRED